MRTHRREGGDETKEKEGDISYGEKRREKRGERGTPLSPSPSCVGSPSLHSESLSAEDRISRQPL